MGRRLCGRRSASIFPARLAEALCSDRSAERHLRRDLLLVRKEFSAISAFFVYGVRTNGFQHRAGELPLPGVEAQTRRSEEVDPESKDVEQMGATNLH